MTALPNDARVIDATFRAILAHDWERFRALKRAYPHLFVDRPREARDDSDWCTRCAARTTWTRGAAGARVACSTCGWQNPWTPRAPLAEFGRPDHDLDATGRSMRPGR